MSKKGNEAPRARRDRGNIRQLLLESAAIEFALKGFDGASTRSIAERVDAHQPQINYHFSSKDDLWRATVDMLFGELDEQIALAVDPSQSVAEMFCELIRVQAEFAANTPQFNQITTHESISPGDRMVWLMETHIVDRVKRVQAAWAALQELGLAAPIDGDHIFHVLTGATCLPYVNAASARLLVDTDPCSPERVKEHVASMIATFLPGYDRGATTTTTTTETPEP